MNVIVTRYTVNTSVLIQRAHTAAHVHTSTHYLMMGYPASVAFKVKVSRRSYCIFYRPVDKSKLLVSLKRK